MWMESERFVKSALQEAKAEEGAGESSSDDSTTDFDPISSTDSDPISSTDSDPLSDSDSSIELIFSKKWKQFNDVLTWESNNNASNRNLQ